jgi:hypothetical protein
LITSLLLVVVLEVGQLQEMLMAVAAQAQAGLELALV